MNFYHFIQISSISPLECTDSLSLPYTCIVLQRQFKMIFLTLLSLLVISTFQQVNHTAIEPTIIRVNPSPQIKTVPSKHSFVIPFDNMGYQISGKVYETNEGLIDAQIHNKSSYVPSTSCQFYNSQLSLDVIKHTIFDDSLNIQASEVSKEKQTVYLLVNDKNYLVDQKMTRVIQAYSFTGVGIGEDVKNITVKSLGLNDSELIDIALLSVNNVLIATDGVKFVGIDATNLSKFWEIKLGKSGVNESAKVDYQFASLNEMLQFDLCHIDTTTKTVQLTVLWNNVIKVYHFSLDMTTAQLVNELTPPKGKSYTSAIIEHNIYALIEGQLVAYRSKPNSTFQATFIDLESKECWGLNKYQSTLHIVCREGGLNYVAEYYYNQDFVLAKDALHLNRYYTQIDDARMTFMFGEERNPKLFIGGENDLLLTAYAINRQVLIDSNQKQAMSRFKSLGLENIVSIPKLSNFSSTYAVGIATQFVVFFRINEAPSEVECYFERKESKMRWNLLVEVNTTNCFGNGEIEQLQSICQYSVPFTYYVSLFEVDSSKELTVHIFVYVVLIACGLLLLGCIFHCKSIRARAVREIQKKMDALRRKKGHKPI